MVIQQASGSPLGGLLILFAMWVLGKILESIWASLMEKEVVKKGKEKVASALSDEASGMIKNLEKMVKELFAKGLKRRF